MLQRLLLLVGLVTLVGCQDNHEGAVKLTVSYSGFKPGCIRVSVKDEAGTSEERTTELAGKGEVTGGQVTVAAFREAGWSPNLALTAQAFEVECAGKLVSTVTRSVKVDKGAVATLELALSGTDADGDGYVSRATGGSDCNDTRGEARPGATESCNGQDDNCDDKPDEGFEVGALCDTTEGCKGAWTCDPQGARTCVGKPDQWRRDSDGDGQGNPNAPGPVQCKQPAGYVPNGNDCDDTNPRRYKDAPELCNAVDDDCDSLPDDGLNLGSACTGAGGCGGQFACNAADAGVRCDSPVPVVLYPDSDNDTRGKADAGVSSCTPTLPGHVSNSNDCDDTQATVYVGATELCDTQDNDCDGTPDDGLDVGGNCPVAGQGCSGKRACAVDGGVQCNYDTPPNNYYPDEDLDQHGKADAGVLTCGPKPAELIAQAGDCNDGNPFTHASRGELCDQEDNNCNGTVDEGSVCPSGGATWVDRSTSSTSDVWRSVALWGDGGVWIAGQGNRLRYQAPGQTSFQNFDGQCAGEWYGVWANPQTGTAHLAGLDERTASHSTTTCTPGPTLNNSDNRGVTGVTQSDGGTELHFAGLDTNNNSLGWALWWNGGSVQEGPTVPAPLRDVHGVSRDVLFAVGGYQGSGSGVGARIYRFKPAESDWKSEVVQDLPDVVDDQLRGIWVVHPKLAYAVGESNSVLRWNGTVWSAHSGPNVGDLYSVVAFGTSSVYVTTGNGRVYRYNGSSWSQLPGASTGTPLWDIAGTHPGDLWVVGDGGKVLHWPR